MVDLCYQVVHLDIHVEGWKQCRAGDDRDIIYLFIYFALTSFLAALGFFVQRLPLLEVFT
jgi:hypothetical protein